MRSSIIRRAGKPNLTGFDPKAFAAAAGTPANDPWARAEAWRYNGPFSRWNRFRGSFPGLGIATVAFAVYLAYDYTLGAEDHHAEGHGDGHH